MLAFVIDYGNRLPCINSVEIFNIVSVFIPVLNKLQENSLKPIKLILSLLPLLKTFVCVQKDVKEI